jgi:subtilase family serine protease
MKRTIIVSLALTLAAGTIYAQITRPPPDPRTQAVSPQVLAGLPPDLVTTVALSAKGEALVTLTNSGKQDINPPPAPRQASTGPPIQVDLYQGSTLVQSLYVPALAGGASRVLTVVLQSNKPRCGESRDLRAVVDPQKLIAEQSDDNNTTSVTATRPCPDLAIKNIERDFSGLLGETYSVKVTIVNLGNAPSPKDQVWATSLPTGVWPVTGWPELVPTTEIPALNPGETKSFHTGGSVLATSRTAVRVMLDRYSEVDEMREDNNRRDEWL